MAIWGGAILFAACLFMLYALVKFHLEAVQPRKPKRHRRVIVFPKSETQTRGPVRAATTAHSQPPDRPAALAHALPFAVRRLATKSASRS